MNINLDKEIEKIEKSREIFRILEKSNEIKSVFRLLIDEQNLKNVEHRIGVCLSKDNTMTLTEPCIGQIISILPHNCRKPEEKCPKESKLVTDYQTLIHDHDIADSKLAIDRKAELYCEGRKNKMVACFHPFKKNIRETRFFIGWLHVGENFDLKTENMLKEKLEKKR
jgi:hypothetical protein